MVLDQHDLDRCEYEPHASKLLLDDEAYILSVPIGRQDPIPAALQNIIDSDLARAGKMLVQSPFDHDCYVEAECAAQSFALAKHLHFSIVCKILGAKEVRVEQINLRTSKSSMSANCEGMILVNGIPVYGTATGESESLQRLRAQLTLSNKYAGGEPDVEAAEQYLRCFRLFGDMSMRSILEMRRGSNQLIEHKLVLSLSNEAKSNLKVAARLMVPAVSLSAKFSRVVEDGHDYTITVLVRF